MNIGNKIRQTVSLLTCCMLLMAVAVNRHERLFGHDIIDHSHQADSAAVFRGDTMVVTTTAIARDINGFAGNTPLEIHIYNGIVTDVRVLENQETATFFQRVIDNGLLQRWIGLTVDKALNKDVEATTEATFSSTSVIRTMHRGLEYAENKTASTNKPIQMPLDAKTICALLVIIAAVVLPSTLKMKHYRTVQLTLNIIVLGFWSGSFLSYTSLIGFFANGINGLNSAVMLLLLIVGFILPLVWRKSVYCAWVCPFGSLQELIGKATMKKHRFGQRHLKILSAFREVLWCILMLLMLCGLYFDWIDYEPFTAFLLGEASWIAIAIAVAFALLSFVVERPYCRFVCPMGTLLRISQDQNKL